MWEYESYVCWGKGEHSVCSFDDCACRCHRGEGRSARRERARKGEKYREGLRKGQWREREAVILPP